ncbi:MAG: right-handed parallel beta-helix repeat-containing protein [Bacteroidales bacterium]
MVVRCSGCLSLSKGHGYVKSSIIEHSASSGMHLSDYQDADVVLNTFSNNAAHGIYYSYYANVNFDYNDFYGNGQNAVYVSSGVLTSYLQNNEAANNGINGIVIQSLAPGYDHVFRNGAGLYNNDFPFVFLNDITFNNSEYIYVYPQTHMKFSPAVSIN